MGWKKRLADGVGINFSTRGGARNGRDATH